MGQRQDRLTALLATGMREALERPSWDRFKAAGLEPEITRVYRQLGGGLEAFPARCGAYDVVYRGQAVELDEERHFNRYRLLTLDSPLYTSLSDFPLELYRSLCVSHESACLKAAGYGGNWSNPSCAKQFSGSPPVGTLEPPGPPRWRQRAFYDFLKDIVALASGPRVVRLPIWQTVQLAGRETTIGQALQAGSPAELTALADIIEAKLKSN